MKPYVFVWHKRWPDYNERMKWINAAWNVQNAKDVADQMTLVEKV